MGILSKLFSSGKKSASPEAGPSVKDMPASPAKTRLMQLYNSPAKENERIRMAVAMKADSENWSRAERSFWYYIIGDALAVRSKREDPRRIPFYAASVFDNPIPTNLGWYEIKRACSEYADLPSTPENAVMLHLKFPLPESFDLLTETQSE